VPHCDVTNDHTQLKDWLTQNYPNFDQNNFDTARQRQLDYFVIANMLTPPLWAYIDSNNDYYNECVFWNVSGTPNNSDSEFKNYVEFFLTHSSWDTPGSIVDFTIENSNDIPDEYFYTGILEV
jgi:hypothetical protein